MINLVFLLLIFFLLTAQITPKALLDVAPPSSEAGEDTGRLPVVVMDSEGQVAFDDTLGRDAVLAALQAEVEALCASSDCNTQPIELTLRAGASASGKAVAALIADLGSIGPIRLSLATVTR